MPEYNLRIFLPPSFEKEFESDVIREVQKKMRSGLPRVGTSVEAQLRTLIRSRITSSDEYASSQNTSLKGEIGVPDILSKIDSIIEIWLESIVVNTIIPTGKRLGGLSIKAIRGDYGDVLASPHSVFEYVNSKQQSKSLEWLRWLLLEGDRPIVSDYFFKASPRGSRTGFGIMVRKSGRSWGVPSELAGTEEDNFVTRSLADIEGEIQIIIGREITKAI